MPFFFNQDRTNFFLTVALKTDFCLPNYICIIAFISTGYCSCFCSFVLDGFMFCLVSWLIVNKLITSFIDYLPLPLPVW